MVHATTINRNYGLPCIKMQAQLVTISQVAVAKLQSWTTKVPHFPEKRQASVTHCAGHTSTNIISCIGWLEGRVATTISCRLWVFLRLVPRLLPMLKRSLGTRLGLPHVYYSWHITHTRKDTKLGCLCREADNKASKITLQYILQSSRVSNLVSTLTQPLW